MNPGDYEPDEDPTEDQNQIGKTDEDITDETANELVDEDESEEPTQPTRVPDPVEQDEDTKKVLELKAAGFDLNNISETLQLPRPVVSRILGGEKMAKTAKKGKTPRVKAVKVEKDCGCGCGQKTYSNYAPGHDARHAAEIARKVVETGKDKFIAELPSEALRAKATKMVETLKTVGDRVSERNAARETRRAEKNKAKEERAASREKSKEVSAAAKPTKAGVNGQEGTVKIGRKKYEAVKSGNTIKYRNPDTNKWEKVTDADVEFVPDEA